MNRLGIAVFAGLLIAGAAIGYGLATAPASLPTPPPAVRPPPPPPPPPEPFRWTQAQTFVDPADEIDSGPPDSMPRWNGKSFRKEASDRALTNLEGMAYAKARKRLKALGYQPVVFKCRANKNLCSEITLPFRKRFPEVLDCAVSGPCLFGWMHPGKGGYLLASTKGEDETPEVTAFDIASWDELAEGQGPLVSPRSSRPPLQPSRN